MDKVQNGSYSKLFSLFFFTVVYFFTLILKMGKRNLFTKWTNQLDKISN